MLCSVPFVLHFEVDSEAQRRCTPSWRGVVPCVADGEKEESHSAEDESRYTERSGTTWYPPLYMRDVAVGNTDRGLRIRRRRGTARERIAR